MRTMRRAIPIVVAAAIAGAAALSSPGCTDSRAEGQRLVQERCVRCHPITTVLNARFDRQGWENVVNNMIARGAQVTPDERENIVDYLSSR